VTEDEYEKEKNIKIVVKYWEPAVLGIAASGSPE
jgi:hypothetical protein